MKRVYNECHLPPPPADLSKHARGFTLAEILIALALLGVIAAFTINKVLVTQGEAKTKAILKANSSEIVSQVVNLINAGSFIESSGTVTTSNRNVFLNSLNAVKQCNYEIFPPVPNDPCVSSIPCKPSTSCQRWHFGAGILPDGSAFALTQSGVSSFTYHLMIDANGPSLPNLIGQDRLIVSFTNVGRLSTPAVIQENGINVATTNTAFYREVFE